MIHDFYYICSIIRFLGNGYFMCVMNVEKYSDQEIVEAILCRNALVTREYLYKKCYPLFCSIYNKYYTDCESPVELINQIYLYILTPNRETGKSKLGGFGFRCTLTTWLKIVTENYCHQLFARKFNSSENISLDGDRNMSDTYSLESNFSTLDKEDVKRVLLMMPNERYRHLIEYRYLYEKSNEETAKLLALTMSNYYNVHLRAKAQFCSALKREGLI